MKYFLLVLLLLCSISFAEDKPSAKGKTKQTSNPTRKSRFPRRGPANSKVDSDTSAVIKTVKNDTSAVDSSNEKEPELYLSSYEEVLAGVLLLQENNKMDADEKIAFYSELLSFSNITHYDFITQLRATKGDMKSWLSTLDTLKSKLK